MNAAEIMTPNPTALPVHSSIRTAMNVLAELDVRHLPVTDDGALVGIVSDRDLRDVVARLLLESGAGPGLLLDRPVGDVMTGDVLSVDPETEVGDIIDLMVEHRIGAVPVLAPGTDTLVGIVSYVDVLRATRTFDDA